MPLIEEKKKESSSIKKVRYIGLSTGKKMEFILKNESLSLSFPYY